jgi:hypothetical protein
MVQCLTVPIFAGERSVTELTHYPLLTAPAGEGMHWRPYPSTVTVPTVDVTHWQRYLPMTVPTSDGTTGDGTTGDGTHR